ncbi:MAG TPA: DUF3551 domain-containing protein [Xanthobacteraceae bacterium]|nr:DUF3551 domain-containing protein [Xanthobacteraceae bacterium]
MRIISLCALVVPVLIFAPHSEVAAQSGYCAIYNDDATPEDCSFPTLRSCRQSVSGVGGRCLRASYAPQLPPAPPPPAFPPFADQRPLFGPPYAFRPAPVPTPPPDAQPFSDSSFYGGACGNPPFPPC